MTKDGLLRVLVLEDSEADAMLLARTLRQAGHGVDARRVDTADAMRAALAEGAWDIVLSDWTMPGFGAAAALEILHESGRDIPFVIVSGTIDEEIAGEAMRAGARDFVLKDRLGRLAPAVERELRDAAERRRARVAVAEGEEKLRQAQKLEAIASVAGAIAHDFNNLLSVISSYADIAVHELDEGSSLRDDMLEIRKATRRAEELTRQLLAFSRRQVSDPQVLDLRELLRELEPTLVSLLGGQFRLSMRIAPELARVRIDREQFQQVVMNLVMNARDAMLRGGTVTIETSDAGELVVMTVSDTGCGMDRGMMERIFEPFYTSKTAGQGAGLGLATVLGIVHACGGTIWVDSELGAGTTFEIRLPRVLEG